MTINQWVALVPFILLAAVAVVVLMSVYAARDLSFQSSSKPYWPRSRLGVWAYVAGLFALPLTLLAGAAISILTGQWLAAGILLAMTVTPTLLRGPHRGKSIESGRAFDRTDQYASAAIRAYPASVCAAYRHCVETNPHGQLVGDLIPEWSARRMPGGVELPGRYVAAEPIHPRHAEALFGALCGPKDEALWTYRPQARPPSVSELDEGVVSLLSEHPESASYAFVPAGGSAAGLATFFPCVPSSGVVEISGILWGRSMQRSTAATEAIHLMLSYAFDRLGYRRVEWKCDSLNDPSGRAALRLGFTCEGRFRQHMVTKGRNRDTDWYAMLDSEWPAIRARHQRWLDPANFDEQGRQRQRLADI